MSHWQVTGSLDVGGVIQLKALTDRWIMWAFLVKGLGEAMVLLIVLRMRTRVN